MKNVPEWKRKSVIGVIKQVKKSIKSNKKVLDCWKYYFRTMSKDTLEIMKMIDNDFIENILKTL